MTPIVIHENQVTLFYFYLNGMKQQGMRYHASLYGLAYSDHVNYRLAIYSFADELAATGSEVVMTLAQNQYKVWVNLSHLELNIFPKLEFSNESYRQALSNSSAA